MNYMKNNSTETENSESPIQDDQTLLSTSWINGPHPIYNNNNNNADDNTSSPGIYYTNIKKPDDNFAKRDEFLRSGSYRKIRKRVIFKNGEYNVLQTRIAKRRLKFLQDIFTTLVDTRWRWTLLVFSLSFVLSWLGFAFIWWIISFIHGDFEEMHLPPNQAKSGFRPCVYNSYNFASLFLFSIETQHTIGYGFRATSEACPEGIWLQVIQCIFGTFIQAFVVGIVFTKMTRPKQRSQTLLFSKNAIICKRDGSMMLMFRVGDIRKTHIIGGSVQAYLIKTRQTEEGELLPQYQTELEIETDGCTSNLFFIWPMIMCHRITSTSPFYNMSATDILQDKFEIVVMIQGTVESTGQSVQARSSYLNLEILWGYRFNPVIGYNRERQGFEIDYGRFNSIIKIDSTPICSAKDLNEIYQSIDTASLTK